MVEVSVDDGRRLLVGLKLAVRDAWRVFARLPDPDSRFRAELRAFPWCTTPTSHMGNNPAWLKPVASSRTTAVDLPVDIDRGGWKGGRHPHLPYGVDARTPTSIPRRFWQMSFITRPPSWPNMAGC
jgi:hypothetical protein